MGNSAVLSKWRLFLKREVLKLLRLNWGLNLPLKPSFTSKFSVSSACSKNTSMFVVKILISLLRIVVFRFSRIRLSSRAGIGSSEYFKGCGIADEDLQIGRDYRLEEVPINRDSNEILFSFAAKSFSRSVRSISMFPKVRRNGEDSPAPIRKFRLQASNGVGEVGVKSLGLKSCCLGQSGGFEDSKASICEAPGASAANFHVG